MEALIADQVKQILRVEVGSTAHGTGLPGKEDLDELAIGVEPPEFRIGIRSWKGTVIHRPGRRHDERSQPGDLDLTIHSLRKWAQLAAKGNPSILSALWAPILSSTYWGDVLRESSSMFVARSVAGPYLGYAQAQRRRLLGEQGGAHVNRPELVEAYGYDTKYAMHMVRLGLQGVELLASGSIQFPAKFQTLLYGIRCGDYPLADVVAMAEANEASLMRLRDTADWPATPDLNGINAFVVECYRAHYL